VQECCKVILLYFGILREFKQVQLRAGVASCIAFNVARGKADIKSQALAEGDFATD